MGLLHHWLPTFPARGRDHRKLTIYTFIGLMQGLFRVSLGSQQGFFRIYLGVLSGLYGVYYLGLMQGLFRVSLGSLQGFFRVNLGFTGLRRFSLGFFRVAVSAAREPLWPAEGSQGRLYVGPRAILVLNLQLQRSHKVLYGSPKTKVPSIIPKALGARAYYKTIVDLSPIIRIGIVVLTIPTRIQTIILQ